MKNGWIKVSPESFLNGEKKTCLVPFTRTMPDKAVYDATFQLHKDKVPVLRQLLETNVYQHLQTIALHAFLHLHPDTCSATQEDFERALKVSSIDAAVLADFHRDNNVEGGTSEIRRWNELEYEKSFFEERVQRPHATSTTQPGASLADLVKKAAKVHEPLLVHCHYLILMMFGFFVKSLPVKNVIVLCFPAWYLIDPRIDRGLSRLHKGPPKVPEKAGFSLKTK